MNQFVDMLNDTAAKDLFDALTGDYKNSKCFQLEKVDKEYTSIQNAAGANFFFMESSINDLIELLRNKLNLPKT